MAVKYNKRRRKKPVSNHFRINTATVISFAVFLYLVVRSVMSMMQPTVSTYEVTAQRIYDKISTTGIALRSEKLASTNQAGYITYYVADGERVGVNSKIYAIDGSGSITSQLAGEDGNVEFSDDNYIDLKNQIMDYKSSYNDSSFGSIYDFKYALDNNIMEITNDSVIRKVDDLIESGEAGSSLNQIKAGESGVVSYCYDGMEGVSLDSVDSSLFENTDNNMQQIRSNSLYAQNSPVYRLVTDENWNLVVELTKEQYDKIKDKEYLKVKFLKDDLTVTRGVTFIERNGSYFAALSFNKYMERYMDDRYLEVELILNSLEGLKIPNSSLVQQKLYAIPVEYAVQSDEAVSGVSFNKQDVSEKGELKASTISPAICYKDEGYYYVSGMDVNRGDVLIKNATQEEIESGDFTKSETYTISQQKEFEGVYTINKGYAQFVVITNLYQADDFCIAEDSMEFGISQYDHVVLDSSAIEEGQIIY